MCAKASTGPATIISITVCSADAADSASIIML